MKVMHTITPEQMPAAIRAAAKLDHRALQAALRLTAEVDAMRWIQWSIRGGGLGGSEAPVVKPPEPSKAKREKNRRKPGIWKRLLGKLGFGRTKKSRQPRVGSKGRPGQNQPEKTEVMPAGYHAPIDRGDYAQSWRASHTSTGWMVYSAAHPSIKAGVIEAGRRAAPIPIEPLADWARRKFNKTPEEALQIAYAISAKAAKQRRPGLWVLKRAHPKIAEALERNVLRKLEEYQRRAGMLPGSGP